MHFSEAPEAEYNKNLFGVSSEFLAQSCSIHGYWEKLHMMSLPTCQLFWVTKEGRKEATRFGGCKILLITNSAGEFNGKILHHIFKMFAFENPIKWSSTICQAAWVH